MANGLKIEKGDIVIFHGSFKGKRYTRIQGQAEESGDTKFKKLTIRVRIKPGVISVPGERIYGLLKK